MADRITDVGLDVHKESIVVVASGSLRGEVREYGRIATGGRGRGVTADVCPYPVTDRPAAGATRAGVRGAASDATGDDGRGASRCRQRRAFQRLGAAGWLFRPPATHSARDLPLPNTPKGTILASQRPGIRGMSN